jgi:hypothetical protein
MIVQSDFLTHWKVKALANRVGMESALTALLALWGHCERRKAWEFELTPLMLAGICDFKGDAGELFAVMAEVKLIDAPDSEGWFQVHQWGKVNAALVKKWVANKGQGWRWHPRGFACQSIDRSIDQSIDRSSDDSIDTTIGLDRIGEDRIGNPEAGGKPPQVGRSSSTPPAAHPDSDPVEDAKKKKTRARDVIFDALLRVCGLPMEGLTKSEGGRVAKAKSEIMAAMPPQVCDSGDLLECVAEIERRAAAYCREWPKSEMTPTALAANWSRFSGQSGAPKKEKARIDVEPDGDWMAAASRLLLPVLPGEQWALIERGWRVQILKELNNMEAAA